jgi:hypothetical protein
LIPLSDKGKKRKEGNSIACLRRGPTTERKARERKLYCYIKGSTRPAVMLIQLSIYWRIDMNHWRPSTSGQRWKRRADAEPLTEERHHTKVQSGVKLGPKL